MNDATHNLPLLIEKKRRERDFALVPKWVIREVFRTRTWYALPLIEIAHTRMRMQGRKSLALTNEVWIELGVLDQPVRHAMLAHLKRVPEILVLMPERRHRWRYRLSYGPLWNRPPPAPKLEDED